MTLEKQGRPFSGEDFCSLPLIDWLGMPKLRIRDGSNGAAAALHWLVEKGSFTIRAARRAADPGIVAEISRETTLMSPI